MNFRDEEVKVQYLSGRVVMVVVNLIHVPAMDILHQFILYVNLTFNKYLQANHFCFRLLSVPQQNTEINHGILKNVQQH